MTLNPAALKTWLEDAARDALRQAGDTKGLKALLDADAVTGWVYFPVEVADILEAVNGTRLGAMASTERDELYSFLATVGPTVDTRKQTVRDEVQRIVTDGQTVLDVAAITRRRPTEFESLDATYPQFCPLVFLGEVLLTVADSAQANPRTDTVPLWQAVRPAAIEVLQGTDHPTFAKREAQALATGWDYTQTTTANLAADSTRRHFDTVQPS